MNIYPFLQQRYDRSLQPIVCTSQFILVLLPVLLLSIFIRMTGAVFFHAYLLAVGWCSWTFTEYMLHRFYMHQKTNKNTGSMTASHQHHHQHPTEILFTAFHRRLLVLLALFSFYLAFVWQNYFTLFAGWLAGFCGYFFMHRLLHTRVAQILFPRLFRYHLYHHCKYPNTCFGISVTWWDDLYKTVPPRPQISETTVAFYFGESKKVKAVANPRDGSQNNRTLERSCCNKKSGCAHCAELNSGL